MWRNRANDIDHVLRYFSEGQKPDDPGSIGRKTIWIRRFGRMVDAVLRSFIFERF
jgi:hypothetical protein